MKLQIISTVVCFLTGYLSLQAQLNGPEKIFVDSLSHYPETGIKTDSGYFIGGQEGSCNIATIWEMDENFSILRKKQLIHDKFEVSEVYDIKMVDTSLHVLTRQLQIENAGSDDGVKWYALNSKLDITDSLYMAWLEPKNGLILDSAWVVNSWRDSLYRLSAKDGRTLHQIEFHNGNNGLKEMNNKIVSWNHNNLLIVDSLFQIDTVPLDEIIVDLIPVYKTRANLDNERIFVLTENFLWHIEKTNNEFMIKDSTDIPHGATSLLYHPLNHELIVITQENRVHYIDADSLKESSIVQLFYNNIYQEDLRHQVLPDGSVLRLGTTLIKVKTDKNILYGKEFGFVHRFDKDYNDETISRSNLSLTNLSISDTYYGLKPQYILGDTVYIITKDQNSKMNWSISNSGSGAVHNAVVSTNTLWGFNCENGYNSRFYSDINLLPGDSIKNTFTVYENISVPHGWERKRFLYAGFANGHYDADFSDNLKRFTLRYIISSSDVGPDPSLINIFPNPARDKVHVNATGNDKIKQISLLDIRGRIMKASRLNFPVSNMNINLASIPDGIYILRAEISSGFIEKKISLVK